MRTTIGTLLASGYRSRELVAHYALPPCLVGFAACALGTAVGATLLVDPMRGMYYSSYDLPPFQMDWGWGIVFQLAVLPLSASAVPTMPAACGQAPEPSTLRIALPIAGVTA